MQDVIRRAELAAIPAGEKKWLYLALVGLAGQHGVACGALPARAPGLGDCTTADQFLLWHIQIKLEFYCRQFRLLFIDSFDLALKMFF